MPFLFPPEQLTNKKKEGKNARGHKKTIPIVSRRMGDEGLERDVENP